MWPTKYLIRHVLHLLKSKGREGRQASTSKQTLSGPSSKASQLHKESRPGGHGSDRILFLQEVDPVGITILGGEVRKQNNLPVS